MMSLTAVLGLGAFSLRADLKDSAMLRVNARGWDWASNGPWSSAGMVNNIEQEIRIGAHGSAQVGYPSEGGGHHGRI
jgi:hypothetical protein